MLKQEEQRWVARAAEFKAKREALNTDFQTVMHASWPAMKKVLDAHLRSAIDAASHLPDGDPFRVGQIQGRIAQISDLLKLDRTEALIADLAEKEAEALRRAEEYRSFKLRPTQGR